MAKVCEHCGKPATHEGWAFPAGGCFPITGCKQCLDRLASVMDVMVHELGGEPIEPDFPAQVHAPEWVEKPGGGRWCAHCHLTQHGPGSIHDTQYALNPRESP